MDLRILANLAPYLASAAISTGVGFYALRRRKVTGAAAFSVSALAQAAWTISYIFELVSPSLKAKIFWDNTQFVGMFLVPLAFLSFVYQYTGRKFSKPRLTWALLSIFPLISLLLVFTDPMHGLIRPQAWLVEGDPFSALVYDFTPTFLVMTVYVYGVTLVGLGLLIERFLRPQRLYRSQVGVILVGMLMPLAGGLLTVVGVTFSIHRDLTPITFALNNLIVAWGLFRYRLLDILPVARDLVIDSMNDAVVVVDNQERVIDLNPAAREVIGSPQTGIIGRSIVEVFSPWMNLVERFRHVDEEHTQISLKVDGEMRHFDVNVSSLPDHRGRPMGRVVVVRDVTELIRAEEEIEKRTQLLEATNTQLEAANEHLKILSRAKDEFVANVSHELRTPITNLKLYLELLAQRPEKRESYLYVLEREADRLESMIRGLLTLSRLDQDRLRITLKPVNLNDLSEEYVADRAAMAESKGLALRFEAHPDLPIVNADHNLMGQVLSILLTNALSYTPSGGEVVVSTTENSLDGQQWAGISVRDTGPGIPPEEKKELFTRFFRGVAGRESDVPGTGLGLAIVKEVVERHHGRVEVESEGIAGKGAVFSVWLPAQER